MVRVNDRGKAYIALDEMIYMPLPHSHIDIPLLTYGGEVYTLVEHLAYLIAFYNPEVPSVLKGRKVNKGRMADFLNRVEPGKRKRIDRTTAKYPSFTTIKVTSVAHNLTKQFIVDFLVTRSSNALGLPMCHRIKTTELKRKAFVNLKGFAQLAQASDWCPDIFSEGIDRWLKEVPKKEDEEWKEKAFISPDLVFLGMKPGNEMTSREKYKYGILVAKKKQRTRSDKIIVESDKERQKPVTLYKEVDGTYILRYTEGYVVTPVEGENKIIIRHE